MPSILSDIFLYMLMIKVYFMLIVSLLNDIRIFLIASAIIQVGSEAYHNLIPQN